MPAGGAPGKIIVVHGFGIETKLLRQIQDTVGGYRRMIRHKEAMPGEKSKLNRQSQSCRLRFAGHERDVRKTQAPGADQIPTRNAKAHNAAPLSERNVVPASSIHERRVSAKSSLICLLSSREKPK